MLQSRLKECSFKVNVRTEGVLFSSLGGLHWIIHTRLERSNYLQRYLAFTLSFSLLIFLLMIQQQITLDKFPSSWEICAPSRNTVRLSSKAIKIINDYLNINSTVSIPRRILAFKVWNWTQKGLTQMMSSLQATPSFPLSFISWQQWNHLIFSNSENKALLLLFLLCETSNTIGTFSL